MKVDLSKYLDAASQSTWALWKLNRILWMGIPFNRPHRISIKRIEDDAITTEVKYRRKNLNHIKGIHACALATAAEFCSGLVLLRNLNPREYRLIMQKLELEYHYQAKSNASARYELSKEDFREKLLLPLNEEGKVFITCEIPVKDSDENLVCTARARWQIKSWKQVKTKT